MVAAPDQLARLKELGGFVDEDDELPPYTLEQIVRESVRSVVNLIGFDLETIGDPALANDPKMWDSETGETAAGALYGAMTASTMYREGRLDEAVPHLIKAFEAEQRLLGMADEAKAARGD